MNMQSLQNDTEKTRQQKSNKPTDKFHNIIKVGRAESSKPRFEES